MAVLVALLAAANNNSSIWIAVAVPIVVALLGGGAVAYLRVHSENAELRAKATKTVAEADVVVATSIQERYDHLFDDLQAELKRLRTDEMECRATLAQTVKDVDVLRLEVNVARVRVADLQDRLERVEGGA